MDQNKIKQILQVYRPGKDDPNDPYFCDAVKALDNDPELNKWFENEKAFDAAFTTKLGELPTPQELKEKLLDIQKQPKAPISFPKRKSPTLTYGLAACLLLILPSLFFIYNKPENKNTQPVLTQTVVEAPNFIAAIEKHAQTYNHKGFRRGDTLMIKHELAKSNAPYPQVIPAKMSNFSGLGCVTFDCHGKPVSLICFKGEKVYHMYVTERKGIKGCQKYKKPNYNRFGKFASATWVNDSQFYTMVVEGSPEDLSKML